MDVEQQNLGATNGEVCFDMVTTKYRLVYSGYLNTFKRMRT